jgi:hypothetical protein
VTEQVRKTTTIIQKVLDTAGPVGALFLNASTPQRLNASTPQRLNASTPQRLNASTPQRLNASTPASTPFGFAQDKLLSTSHAVSPFRIIAMMNFFFVRNGIGLEHWAITRIFPHDTITTAVFSDRCREAAYLCVDLDLGCRCGKRVCYRPLYE